MARAISTNAHNSSHATVSLMQSIETFEAIVGEKFGDRSSQIVK